MMTKSITGTNKDGGKKMRMISGRSASEVQKNFGDVVSYIA